MEEEEEEEEEEGGEEDQEEEAWLDALEAGQVNERGYLPEKRDSSSLTARQVHTVKSRALLHRPALDWSHGWPDYSGTSE